MCVLIVSLHALARRKTQPSMPVLVFVLTRQVWFQHYQHRVGVGHGGQRGVSSLRCFSGVGSTCVTPQAYAVAAVRTMNDWALSSSAGGCVLCVPFVVHVCSLICFILVFYSK